MGPGAVPVRRLTRRDKTETAVRPVLHQAHVAFPRPADHVRDHQDYRAETGCAMRVLFWACAAFVFYAFIGYAALVWLLARLRPRPVKRAVFQPSVSLVITVHNAANFIEAKLKNLSELSYPKERLEIIVASDGSTDASVQILSASRGVKTVICPRV